MESIWFLLTKYLSAQLFHLSQNKNNRFNIIAFVDCASQNMKYEKQICRVILFHSKKIEKLLNLCHDKNTK